MGTYRIIKHSNTPIFLDNCVTVARKARNIRTTIQNNTEVTTVKDEDTYKFNLTFTINSTFSEDLKNASSYAYSQLSLRINEFVSCNIFDFF